MGVDVAAGGGLRAVEVACHTVPCHLQVKFAEFLVFFFPLQLEGCVTLSYNVPADAGAERVHFLFRGGGGVLMAVVLECRVAAVHQTLWVLLQQQQLGTRFLMRLKDGRSSKSTYRTCSLPPRCV